MFFRQIVTAATLTLLPLAASATTLFVPVAGTGPGANGSRWATELTIHSVSSRAINADVLFHDLNGATEPSTITVAPRATVSVDDIVKTSFGREQATGALEIRVADSDANRITVNSRTYNITTNGTLGQDIPAFLASDAATAGDLSVIAGPSTAADQRFNFGIYALETTTVQWALIDADGTVAATKELTYQGGTQAQHGVGIVTLFGATPLDGQTVHATVASGSAIFYGSAVDNRSGDPTYVPALRARGDVNNIDFAGIDEDEDGTVDLVDADGDGVIDSALTVPTSLFPTYFRIVVNGGDATYAVVSSPVDVVFLDPSGTTMIAAGGGLKGTTGSVKVRVTVGGESAVITIPVKFV